MHKLTPSGVLTQVYAFSTADVDGAIFNFGGIAADGVGNVYLSNGIFTLQSSPNISYTSIGNTVLKLSSQGVLSTIAGTRGQAGFNDGQGLNADIQITMIGNQIHSSNAPLTNFPSVPFLTGGNRGVGEVFTRRP